MPFVEPEYRCAYRHYRSNHPIWQVVFGRRRGDSISTALLSI